VVFPTTKENIFQLSTRLGAGACLYSWRPLAWRVGDILYTYHIYIDIYVEGTPGEEPTDGWQTGYNLFTVLGLA